jgi:hypothetical protein
MILGLSVGAFTLLHVFISLVAIASGVLVLIGMLGAQRMSLMTGVVLVTTILTSATGFLFRSKAIGPPHIVGVISLVVLAVALLALYGRKLAGAWRATYVICALVALWFNVFVLIVQAFQKVAFLNALAPKGSEPPFLVAQLAMLVLFIILGWQAVRRFHPAPA